MTGTCASCVRFRHDLVVDVIDGKRVRTCVQCRTRPRPGRVRNGNNAQMVMRAVRQLGEAPSAEIAEALPDMRPRDVHTTLRRLWLNRVLYRDDSGEILVYSVRDG